MNKQELRNKYKSRRAALSQDEIAEMSLSLANTSLEVPIWTYDFYHLFLTIPEKKEIDTEPLLHILQGKDKNIVVPKSDFQSGKMRHFLLTDATRIGRNRFGIPEPLDGIEVVPRQIQAVFLPLLAFDLKGNRVGYGKGFYDRFLSECSDRVLKIGLSLFEAEEEIKDINPLDIPLDICITPGKIYTFKNL